VIIHLIEGSGASPQPPNGDFQLQRKWGQCPDALSGPLPLIRRAQGHGRKLEARSTTIATAGRILDFKDAHASAIEEFRAKIDPILGSNFAICVIPSHDPAKARGPLHTLAGQLAGQHQRTDASACLIRHKLIPKLATGGSRAKQVHMDSIRVEHAGIVRGRAVLILDDVTTSGGSMDACMDLLRAAGAAEVRGLCLGKTA